MSKNTVLIRIPKSVYDSMKRVMPDELGFKNTQRIAIMWKSSAVNIEDFLNNRKPKVIRK